jgi:hypothetical protein
MCHLDGLAPTRVLMHDDNMHHHGKRVPELERVSTDLKRVPAEHRLTGAPNRGNSSRI